MISTHTRSQLTLTEPHAHTPASEFDRSRCPLCGRPIECGAARGESDCWCQSVTIPQEVLDRVPAEARGVACVCRRCAGVETSAREELSRGA